MVADATGEAGTVGLPDSDVGPVGCGEVGVAVGAGAVADCVGRALDPRGLGLTLGRRVGVADALTAVGVGVVSRRRSSCR